MQVSKPASANHALVWSILYWRLFSEKKQYEEDGEIFLNQKEKGDKEIIQTWTQFYAHWEQHRFSSALLI